MSFRFPIQGTARRSAPKTAGTVRSAGVAAVMLITLVGCRFEIARVRRGQPIDHATFETLEPGSTSRGEALGALGAPDDVQYESGKSRLGWEYVDETFFGARTQVPLALFGYRHDLLRYFQDRDAVHRMELLFDDDGVLEQKSIRLPEEQREDDTDHGARWHLVPRIEHSFLIVGDADVADYEDLFDHGTAVGLELGYQPVAPLTVSLGGRYQHYPGRGITGASGTRFEFDDLELFTTEGTLRVQLPLRVFASRENFSRIWDLFLGDDPATHDGWLYFIEAGLGITVNGHVPLWIDGARSGSLFSAGPVVSSVATSGIEYSARRVSVRAGLVYRSTDGFDQGDSRFDVDPGAFQTLGGFVSVGLKF